MLLSSYVKTLCGAKKFSLKGAPMILVPFFFSRRALSIGISRGGIGFKVTEIVQTDTHSIARLTF